MPDPMTDAYDWSPPVSEAMGKADAAADAAEAAAQYLRTLRHRLMELEEDLACQTARAEAAEQDLAEARDEIGELRRRLGAGVP